MKSKEKFIENFKKSFGNISLACEASQVSRQTYYNWINSDEDFKKECVYIEERNLDFAEMKLINAIREGRTAELLFYLKTKGKSRGYVERQEITGASGQKLFEVVIVDQHKEIEASSTHQQSLPDITKGDK
jgi:hypothetical protein